MAITIGQVEAELLAVRAIEGDCRTITALLIEVVKVIKDEPPIWSEIDPSTAQRDTVLAKYDSLKASLKTKVAAY